MPATRPASGGGRWVRVPPDRLDGFLARFTDRHGSPQVDVTETVVTVTAPDGAVAELHIPFPPLRADATDGYGGLVAHVLRPRRVGVLLVRRGGFACGVFEGERLLIAKVGSRHVQGRTAAGGWSQQRFARRRDGQVRLALAAAADAAAAVLLPEAAALEALVAGGDRAAADEVLRDPRLRPLLPLLVARRLDVPDPRRRVLEATPAAFRGVDVRVDDPVTG